MTLCTLLLTVACNNDIYVPANSQGAKTACRNVKHASGITCVPQKFERLVTIDPTSFENAIALGIKPVGSVFSNLSSNLKDEFVGVENIGQVGEPSLESVLLLKPDLILGLDYQQSIYSQASQISPTVLFKFEHSGQWKDMFQKVSTVLGRENAPKQAMDKYYLRLKEFKQKIGNNPSKIKVSVVRVYPDRINLYLRDSFCGIVLQDAGLSRPKSQDIPASVAEKLFGNPIQTSISNELFEKADGDFIFILTGENTSQETQAAEKKLEQLKSNPLWKNLKAVQQNKVYTVPNYWIGSGVLSANAVIDDLFKYLVNTP
ncbi:iron-siderophore ABC transporter substrate-binding protein [Calothrix sp. CCY 0018]|uniref:iron-siderophore ABC transporter substrate-binding protein n=1 Tax=Calothrix sp. CCY 0018 TaxID=3103864 RepID=UPI0039C72C02